MTSLRGFADLPSFIKDMADLLRGPYKAAQYGRVVLPFVVLRRLDCVLDDTREAVLAEYARRKDSGIENLDPFLTRAAGRAFYNVSGLTFERLKDDPANVLANMEALVAGFSKNARDILERYSFLTVVKDLDEKSLLYKTVKKFATIDLHPNVVENHDMGLIFEHLIHHYADLSNESAGEHFTPREVIRLMVNVLFAPDDDALTKPGVVRSLYDPTAGTGGILSVAEEHVHALNAGARLVVFGQELNPETYAICKADLLIKGQDVANIKYGNTLSHDGHPNRRFDYMAANPPYGVKWEDAKEVVEAEYKKKGFAGRFGPGLPRISDGSLLFLLHMTAKMDQERGSRIGIVFNGSPLFSGDAGSGESEIRRWLIENDLLETIIALPTELFYNTGIATYIWIVTNRKAPERKGVVQLIDASGLFAKMKKSLGFKRNYITDDQIDEITKVYCAFEDSGISKIVRGEEFAYRKVTVERPLRLDFQASPDRVERLTAAPAFAALAASKKKGEAAQREIADGERQQAEILEIVSRLDAERLYLDRDEFETDLQAAAKAAGAKLTAAHKKIVLAGLAERNEQASVCRTPKGAPEPDVELRDTEAIPVLEDLDAYLNREVLPYVPDAWVDASREKLGYEIPFTRYFRRAEGVRPPAEVAADLRALEADVLRLLQEVVA